MITYGRQGTCSCTSRASCPCQLQQCCKDRLSGSVLHVACSTKKLSAWFIARTASSRIGHCFCLCTRCLLSPRPRVFEFVDASLRLRPHSFTSAACLRCPATECKQLRRNSDFMLQALQANSNILQSVSKDLWQEIATFLKPD